MNIDKPYFADIKVGDKAWTTRLGECECIEIRETMYEFPIYLKNSNGLGRWYTRSGKEWENDAHQTAFYQRPHIIDKGKPPEMNLSKPKKYKLYRPDTEEFFFKEFVSHSEMMKWAVNNLPDALSHWRQEAVNELKTWFVNRYLSKDGLKSTTVWCKVDKTSDFFNQVEVQATTKEEAEAIALSMPWKRKVNKTVERWVNVYSTCIGECNYIKKEYAQSIASAGVLDTIKLTGEYEVTEEV